MMLTLGSISAFASESMEAGISSDRSERDLRELCTFTTSIKNIAEVGQGVDVKFEWGQFGHATGVMSSYLYNSRRAVDNMFEVVRAYNMKVDGLEGPRLTESELAAYNEVFAALQNAGTPKSYSSVEGIYDSYRDRANRVIRAINAFDSGVVKPLCK